jgi:hypothetical protein
MRLKLIEWLSSWGIQFVGNSGGLIVFSPDKAQIAADTLAVSCQSQAVGMSTATLRIPW